MAVSSLLLSLASCGGNKTPIDVILMAGQSNMVGCSAYSSLSASIGSSKYNEYSSGYKNIKICYSNWTKNDDGTYLEQNSSKEKFVTTLLGEGNSDLTFGPEIGIAETLSSAGYDNKVVMIKYACGASNLLDDWSAPSTGKRSQFYPGIVAYVQQQMKALEALGYQPTLKVFCWMQGEGDSFDGYCNEYYNQLSALVTGLRNDLSSYSDGTEFGFVDGGISDSTSWPRYSIVNSAKKQFAAQDPTHNKFIDTIAAGLDKTQLQSDNAHYVGSAMLSLGKLFAADITPFLSPLNGTKS